MESTEKQQQHVNFCCYHMMSEMTKIIEQNDSIMRKLETMEEQQKPALIKEKTDEYERKLKQQQNQLKGYAKKTKKLEQKIEEQRKKIEEYECSLRKKTKEKENQVEEQMVESISPNSLSDFLNENNLEVTRNCPYIIDGIANLLYKEKEGDSDDSEPLLNEIRSLEQRRRKVIDFIDFIRINWINPYSGTDIQQNIFYWFYDNWKLFLYKPSEEEKEKSRKMFSNKFKLKNTIGTIHFLSIQHSDCTRYYCFAISDYRIVHCIHSSTQQQAYSDLYVILKQQQTWTANTKFAIKMEVNDGLSDTFIHTSNKDVFVENEKVVTWIKNNFNMKDNNITSCYYDNLPALYSYFVKFYDSSSI